MAKNGNKIRTVFYIILACLTIAGVVSGGIFATAQYVGKVNNNCKKIETHEEQIALNTKATTEMKNDIAWIKKDTQEQKQERNMMMEMQREILRKLP